MKLKKLEIIDYNFKSIRTIDLSLQHYLIGEVEKITDKKTSNALGKTVFLNMVSYCLCGNMVNDLKELKGYRLKLTIIINNKELLLCRVIGESSIEINGELYSLEIAKEKLNINRTMIHHMIHLDERKNIILDTPNKFELYQAAYSILGLSDIITNYTSEFYKVSDKISSKLKRKKELETNIGDEDEKILLEKELKNVDDQLKKISELDEDEIKNQNEELYKNKKILTNKKNILLSNKSENYYRIGVISDYIHSLEEVPQDTLNFIKRANKELGDLLDLKINDALEYHKLFSQERTKMLIAEKKILQKEILSIENELEKIEKKLPSISKTIKETNEIRRLFEIQNKLYEKKQELILTNQSLLEVNTLKRDIELLKQKKTEIREELLKCDISSITKPFIDYSNELVTKLYPDIFKSFFDIKIIDYNKINTKKLPIEFDFRINKDNSEGVRNVRNIIVDLIMLKFSKNVDFMAWDSNTFNGIDPNQLKIIFEEINNISKTNNKQVIICFNSFQLAQYYDEIFSNEKISDKHKTIFNHSSTLLNIEF
ncbi:DUF2326 domain-containing protein [Thomasclavelia cocleata]|uniref:DUF2326 domain-containing protein n=3 Tax=Thomasclavelia cocleata TaxID=69824 RepID=UPI00255A90A7|nr:DUF2326 domain-containing protein [Thomasclavelia cocleata]